jgi:hypothetical protein
MQFSVRKGKRGKWEKGKNTGGLTQRHKDMKIVFLEAVSKMPE